MLIKIYETLKGSDRGHTGRAIFHKTFFKFRTAKKGFVEDGSAGVPAVRSF
jgi:hypothetical protein